MKKFISIALVFVAFAILAGTVACGTIVRNALLTPTPKPVIAAPMSAAPNPYTPSFKFADWQVFNPTSPLPGNQVDIQLSSLSAFTAAVLARVALIQRDDGALVNGIVTRDSLSPGIATGMNPPVPWAAHTDYGEEDSVMQNGSWYWSKVAHNSGGAFDASKWQFIGTFFSADPATLALTATAFANGALSADATGRAKMADGYVTAAKLDSGLAATIAAGKLAVWCGFQERSTSCTLNSSGTTLITASSQVGDAKVGDYVTFSGFTANPAVLNGTWKITALGPGAGQYQFNVMSAPGSPLVNIGADPTVINVGAQGGVSYITKISTGVYQVGFITPFSNTLYASVVTPNTEATQADWAYTAQVVNTSVSLCTIRTKVVAVGTIGPKGMAVSLQIMGN